AAGSVLALVWAWRFLGMSVSGLTSGLGDVANLVERMTPPTFNDLGRTVELAVDTFFIALLGTSLAVALSVPVAFLAAANTTPHRAVHAAARAVIVFCRAVPDLVFAAIFVRSIGIGLLAGILALALHSIGMLGKLFADAIEQVDETQRDAVRATGAGRLQELATAVVPQVLPSFVGVALYRLDINVRVSVVLGFVGAGGIGFALQAALRSLNYPAGLGIVAVIVVLVIGVEVFSSAVRRSILGDAAAGPGVLGRPRRRPVRVQHAPFDHYDPRPPWTRERRTKASFLLLYAALVAYAFVSIDISPLELARGIPDMWRTAGLLLPPGLGGVPWFEMQTAMLESIAVGAVATVIGLALGLPIGFLAARNVAPARWVHVTARLGLVLWRSVPELIIAVIFVAAIGLGPVGGTLALGLASVGFVAKLVADAVEEVEREPREAVLATGATRLQETATAVVPAALPGIVGHALYMLDVNLRSSTILGIVGGGGIGFLLFNSLRVQRFEVTGAILLMIFVTVYAIERISGWVRSLLLRPPGSS
ncbi:MAG: phosphonate ABC transporter, permease protein PhnE, partial [Chloroflexi bacterium]|nr:phosphonate ABC transporter, permease protein PhnE [Chloroflexota bacterium]